MLSGGVRILEGLSRWLQRSGQAVLAFMALTIFYDAMMRYLFTAPTTWSLEVNSFLLVYLAIIPAADTLRRGEQISISLLPDRLKPRGRAALFVIISIVGVAFSAILAWRGFLLAHDAWFHNERVSSVFGTPMVFPYAILPIGFGVLAVQFLVEGLRALGVASGRLSPDHLQPGKAEVQESERVEL